MMPITQKLAHHREIARLPVCAIVFVLATFGACVTPACASGHGAPAAPAKDAEVTVSAESADGTRAIKLGEFSIRVYHTVSSRKDVVSFVLYAVVGKDNYPDFEHSYGHRKNKVRDQVIIATRLVPIEDYDDPELKKFRRRILLRLRRALPELAIDELYFSDFSLMSEST